MACKSPVGLKDFCSEGRTDINHWSEVAVKGHFVVRETGGVVMKHDPVIPANFAEMADIGSVAGHDSFGGLAMGLVDVVDSAQMDVSFQFNAMVPKGLRGSGLEHLP